MKCVQIVRLPLFGSFSSVARSAADVDFVVDVAAAAASAALGFQPKSIAFLSFSCSKFAGNKINFNGANQSLRAQVQAAARLEPTASRVAVLVSRRAPLKFGLPTVGSYLIPARA